MASRKVKQEMPKVVEIKREVTRSQRFMIARNWYKRPTLQHVLATFDLTACGRTVSVWPYRSYGNKPIEALLCLKCAKSQGIKLPDLEDLVSDTSRNARKAVS
jgi:hypothetical protein